MPRIICRYDVCVFNKDSLCTAKEIEYDPDQGCLTAQDRDEFVGILEDEEEWEEEEGEEAEEEGEEALEEEELEDEEEDDFFEEGDLEEEAEDDDEY